MSWKSSKIIIRRALVQPDGIRKPTEKSVEDESWPWNEKFYLTEA
jgi:hypothetical protein